MLTIDKILINLKKRYNIIAGEKTIEEVRLEINKKLKGKIKISGRSLETGKKKTIITSIAKLLEI
ncbi:hypothetical protein ACFL0P_07240 [Candidatus Omnitrophota bacterium]